jgi:hypothetical protein
MKQCTKCKIEKELNQFQTYWHSTQQKNRTRGHCTECYYKQKNERKRLRTKEANLIQVSIRPEIIQPVQPELQPAILENNPNYKQCRTCQEYLELNKFYHHKSKSKSSYLDCRKCLNKKDVDKSRKEREEYIRENGGSERHKQKPGEWIDEYQKEATYNILKAIGWKLNKDNGIWWKEGIKNSDGVFINIKNSKRYKITSFENYPIIINTHQKKEIFDRAVVLRNKGVTYRNISYEVGLSETTIYNWLNYK